jgi:hypothetical protein
MPQRSIFLYAFVLVPWLVAQATASEPELPPLIQKWQAATKSWQTLSAHVQVWDYDHTRRTASYQRGRLYLEQEGNGRYQLSATDYLEGVDWTSGERRYRAARREPIIVIWNELGTTLLYPEKKQGDFLSKSDQENVRDSLVVDTSEWWNIGGAMLAHFAKFKRQIAHPEFHLPIVLNRDADATLKRFSLGETDEKEFVLFTPRKDDDLFPGKELTARFDAKTNLADAVMVHDDRETHVIELSDIRIDWRPKDRDAMLDSNPPDFRISNLDPTQDDNEKGRRLKLPYPPASK